MQWNTMNYNELMNQSWQSQTLSKLFQSQYMVIFALWWCFCPNAFVESGCLWSGFRLQHEGISLWCRKLGKSWNLKASDSQGATSTSGNGRESTTSGTSPGDEYEWIWSFLILFLHELKYSTNCMGNGHFWEGMPNFTRAPCVIRDPKPANPWRGGYQEWR